MNIRKIKVSALSVIGLAFLVPIAFGQNNQINQSPINNVSTPQTTFPAMTGTNSTNRPSLSNSNLNVNNSNLNNLQPINGGQHSCRSHELNEQHYQDRGILQEFNQSYMTTAQSMANYNAPKTSGVNEISVIFHVVHNPNNPAENVSNSAIIALYNDIVDDFSAQSLGTVRPGFGFTPADANITFCLATQTPAGAPLAEVGVVRVSTTEDFYDSNNGEENKMKSSATGGSQIWNRNNYLNVWICDITNGAGFGTAGYAYRPTTSFLPGANIDGIVIDYNIGMGGNVLTHEIGHYLGLDHVWGGSGSCSSDDGFTDTPNTIGPADNQPGFFCGMANFQTCGPEVQYENFMDYATGCSAMYTQEQADYMLLILQGIRSSLLLSPGCDPTNTPPNSDFVSNPSGPGPIVIPQNASVSFYDASTNVPTGWAWTISGTQGVDWDWISSTNQNTQNPVAEFYSIGNYDVTLTASNAFGSDLTPAIENLYIQVVGAATGNTCDTLRNWDPVDVATNNFTYYLGGSTNGAWGYIPGHNHLDLYGNGSSVENTLQYAEQFTYAGTADVRALEFPVFILENNSGTGTVNFVIYDDDNGVNPGSILATETVSFDDLTVNAFNHIEFTTPASVTGTFFAGYQLNYNPTQDTLLIGMSGATIAGGNDAYFMEMDTYGWLDAGLLGITGSIALDVLLSNGNPPVMDFTATSNEICVGGDILVDGSISTENLDYRWYVTDDPWVNELETSTSSSNTFNFPYAPGNYNIYLFGSASCNSSGVFMPVTVFAAPTATVTPTNTSCGNNNGIITVTAPTGGGGTFYYSIDGVNYQTSPTFNNLAPGSYTVSVATLDAVTGTTLGSGCITTYPVSINSSSPISTTVSANLSICPGASANITAGGGTGYTWYNGATSIGATSTVSVSPAATTQYSCVVTSGACSATVYTTVTVRTPPAAPTVTASGPTTICAGQDIDLTSSYATGNTWSNADNSSTITVSTAGPFTVTHTDVYGCVSPASAPMTITINPIPVIASGTVSNPSACSSSTGSIQVTGSGTGNVSWTGTAAGSATGVTLPFVVPTLPAGSYDITFEDAIGCTSNTLSITLSDPTPPATPTISASGPVTFCAGGSVTLTSSQTSGNVWSANAGSTTTQGIIATTTGNYTVTYTDGSGCSATSAPTLVTVNNNPAAPTITASGATTFCAGGSVNLTSSQGTGNVWSANAGSATTQTVPVNTSGSYTVTFTNGNGCSTASAATVVTVNPLPIIAEGTLTSPTSCGSATGSIEVTGSGTGNVTWSGSASGSATGVTLPYVIPTLGAGNYNITFENGNGCVSSVLSSSLSDPTPPATPTISASGSTTICAGESVTLTSSQATGNVWSANAGGATAQGISATNAGSYTVTYTDGSGCSATSAPTVVTVNALPTVTQSALSTVCVYNSPVTLTGGSPASGTYSGTGVSSGSFNPATAGIGTHTITYTYTDGNSCSASATADITVDGCAAIGENDLSNLKVYPNPTENKLTIELSGDFNFEITDTKGRIIEKGNGNNFSTINTTNYTSGVYFLNLSSENVNTMIRIVKN